MNVTTDHYCAAGQAMKRALDQNNSDCVSQIELKNLTHTDSGLYICRSTSDPRHLDVVYLFVIGKTYYRSTLQRYVIIRNIFDLFELFKRQKPQGLCFLTH